MNEYQNAVEKLVLSKERETTIYELLKSETKSAEMYGIAPANNVIGRY